MSPYRDQIQWRARSTAAGRPGSRVESWADEGSPQACHARPARISASEEAHQERAVAVYDVTALYRAGLKPLQHRAVITLASGRVLRECELLWSRESGAHDMACRLREVNPGSQES